MLFMLMQDLKGGGDLSFCDHSVKIPLNDFGGWKVV